MDTANTKWYQIIKLPTNVGEFPRTVYLRESYECVFTESFSLATATHAYYQTKYPTNRYVIIAIDDSGEST